MCTCQNGTNTMSGHKWKETLVEYTPLAQSYNKAREQWASFLESMSAYIVRTNAPRTDSFTVNI